MCAFPIAGGWAIDLHLRRVTRRHEDIEVVASRDNVQAVTECFARLERFAIGGGEAWPLARAQREEDTADLELTLPTLSSDQAEWLNGALEIVHPNHHWIARLIEIL